MKSVEMALTFFLRVDFLVYMLVGPNSTLEIDDKKQTIFD
jgi:hypothetical protein